MGRGRKGGGRREREEADVHVAAERIRVDIGRERRVAAGEKRHRHSAKWSHVDDG